MKQTGVLCAILISFVLSACAGNVSRDEPKYVNIPDFINESTLVYTVTCNSGTEKINQYYIDDFQHGMTVTLYGKTTYYFFTYPAGSSRLEWFKINSNGKLEELLARQRDAELEVLAPHLYEWMREGENTWIHGNDVAYKNDCVEIKE